MRPTLEYIERKFNEFNELCFGGELPALPFRISSARTFLGQISYVKKRNRDGSWSYRDFTFRVSNRHDLPEPIVEDTIIHEMIHYHILYNQLQDNAPHGLLFRRKMNEINKRFGRNVSISHRRTAEESESDTERRRHLICISQFKDGRFLVTIPVNSPTVLFCLWNSMERISEITAHMWISSYDPFFNRYPRSRKAKFYRISQEDLRKHLADSRLLRRDGNRITIDTATTPDARFASLFRI